jgi:hypothetical protein
MVCKSLCAWNIKAFYKVLLKSLRFCRVLCSSCPQHFGVHYSCNHQGEREANSLHTLLSAPSTSLYAYSVGIEGVAVGRATCLFCTLVPRLLGTEGLNSENGVCCIVQ